MLKKVSRYPEDKTLSASPLNTNKTQNTTHQNAITGTEKYIGLTYLLVIKKKSNQWMHQHARRYSMYVQTGKRHKGFGQGKLSKAASASCGWPDQDGRHSDQPCH